MGSTGPVTPRQDSVGWKPRRGQPAPTSRAPSWCQHPGGPGSYSEHGLLSGWDSAWAETCLPQEPGAPPVGRGSMWGCAGDRRPAPSQLRLCSHRRGWPRTGDAHSIHARVGPDPWEVPAPPVQESAPPSLGLQTPLPAVTGRPGDPAPASGQGKGLTT